MQCAGVNTAYSYALALLIGAGGAWYVQGVRWSNDVHERDAVASAQVAANVSAVNDALIESQAQTEALRSTFIDYKAGSEREVIKLESAVAAGTVRLRVAARAATVRTAAGDASGTGTGTCELDTSARTDYFTLRRGLDQQFALLQLCRGELRKRSAVTVR